MKPIVAFLVMCTAATAIAAPADCGKVTDDRLRLVCYDLEFGRPVAGPTASSDPPATAAASAPRKSAASSEPAASAKKWLKSNVTVRSDAQVSGFGFPLGEDPAQIGYTRIRGEGATTAQFAALVKGPTFGAARPMSTFFGVAIDRDTLASEPTDVRQAIVGAHWIAMPIPVDGQVGLQALFNGRAQKDYEAGIRREVAVAQGLVVIKGWQHGTPDVPWSHITTPYFGVLRAHSNSGASPAAASRTSFYAGLTSTVYPFDGWSDRISFALTGQLTRDASIASEFDRQTYRYGKAAISWRLTQANKDWIKPYLTVSREAGSDPITGKYHKSKTFAGISLQVGAD